MWIGIFNRPRVLRHDTANPFEIPLLRVTATASRLPHNLHLYIYWNVRPFSGFKITRRNLLSCCSSVAHQLTNAGVSTSHRISTTHQSVHLENEPTPCGSKLAKGIGDG